MFIIWTITIIILDLTFFRPSNLIPFRKCNAGKPWSLLIGQVVPKIDTNNALGDMVAEAIEEAAERSTTEAVINAILRNSSQNILQYVNV